MNQSNECAAFVQELDDAPSKENLTAPCIDHLNGCLSCTERFKLARAQKLGLRQMLLAMEEERIKEAVWRKLEDARCAAPIAAAVANWPPWVVNGSVQMAGASSDKAVFDLRCALQLGGECRIHLTWELVPRGSEAEARYRVSWQLAGRLPTALVLKFLDANGSVIFERELPAHVRGSYGYDQAALSFDPCTTVTSLVIVPVET